MRRILAIDTTADACSLALHSADTRLSFHQSLPRQHARQLLPRLDALFAEAGWSRTDIDLVAYGRGPGSFTGIRIAAGVAQGLALGADCPLVPVSTLQTLAFEVARPGESVWVALDARMSELYLGRYRVDAGSLPRAEADEALLAPADLPDPRSEVRLAGNGWLTDYGFSPAWHARLADHSIEAVLPRAEYGARLAERLVDEDAGWAMAPEAALPVYLRDKVTWDKKPRVGS